MRLSCSGAEPRVTAGEAAEAARAFPNATVIPLHFEHWAHFTEGRADLERAFNIPDLRDRLVFPEPGRPIDIPLR